MSRFNTLYMGEPNDAADILDDESPPESVDELRAALTNALRRIAQLETVVASLQDLQP